MVKPWGPNLLIFFFQGYNEYIQWTTTWYVHRAWQRGHHKGLYAVDKCHDEMYWTIWVSIILQKGISFHIIFKWNACAQVGFYLLQNNFVYAIAGFWFMAFYIPYVVKQFLHIKMATNFYQMIFWKITHKKKRKLPSLLFLIWDDIQKWY